ncbi:MAG: DUF6576 domain-containing protein [Bacteroidota bacterium]
MEIKQQIRDFLNRYQTSGWLIALMVGGLVIQGLLYLVLAAAGGTDLYQTVVDKLVLPLSFKDLLFQPWSLVTWPFFSSEVWLLSLLFAGFILWAFGRIHQQLLNDERTRRLVILAIPIIGLMTVTVNSIVGYRNVENPVSPIAQVQEAPKEAPADAEVDAETDEGQAVDPTETDATNPGPSSALRPVTRHYGLVSGLMPIIIMLMISCITLVPEYPIQLFLFGQVKIVWVGIVILLLEIGFAAFISPLALAIVFGAIIGFLHVYFLRNGTDVTARVWDYYQSSGRRDDAQPRMKVKRNYGAQKEKQHKKKPSSERKSKIPQEVIDKILDKIHDSGYENLTREEKELLFKASNQREDEAQDK